MKRNVPTVLLVVVGAVIAAGLIFFGIKSLGSDSTRPSPELEKSMDDFRSQNAQKTGGTVDDQSGAPVDSRSGGQAHSGSNERQENDEMKARNAGH